MLLLNFQLTDAKRRHELMIQFLRDAPSTIPAEYLATQPGVQPASNPSEPLTQPGTIETDLTENNEACNIYIRKQDRGYTSHLLGVFCTFWGYFRLLSNKRECQQGMHPGKGLTNQRKPLGSSKPSPVLCWNAGGRHHQG